uniref:Uncharacterized protein n=1 Tax=Lepeophtheirus salmonis TaxID=72036 RepID=A0A0K2VH43_LEPSM
MRLMTMNEMYFPVVPTPHFSSADCCVMVHFTNGKNIFY